MVDNIARRGINMIKNPEIVNETIYTLQSTSTTTIPSDVDGVVIYSSVLPAGTYLASIKLYLDYSGSYDYYVRCNNSIRVQRKAPVSYEQLSGVITSNGTTPTVVALYQKSGVDITRVYNYDELNFVKLN